MGLFKYVMDASLNLTKKIIFVSYQYWKSNRNGPAYNLITGKNIEGTVIGNNF